MKRELFSKVAILGLGLIGGSIALEIKKQKLAHHIVGYNRSKKGREIALQRGGCDQAYEDAAKAVQGADLVILAVPVLKIPILAQQIRHFLKPGCIVTDVGSTKENLVRKLSKIFPKDTVYIGGHPIAGTEQSGMESAQLELFEDRWWIFTPTRFDAKGKAATHKLKQLVKKFGAKPVQMSPHEHDHALAAISHLPNMIAFSLVDAVVKERGGKFLQVAGRSFKDFSRVAASSGEMWGDICLDNRTALLKMMRRFELSFQKLKKLVNQGDLKKLQNFFLQISSVRKNLS